MTDFQYLYFVLALIYLSECFFWVRRGSLILVGPAKGEYAVKFPSTALGNDSGGIVFLGVLPPGGGAFAARPIPFSITPQAATAISPYAIDSNGGHQTPAAFEFSAIRSIKNHDDEVRVDDSLFLRAGNGRAADGFGKLLKKLKAQKEADRGRAIDRALARMTDISEIGNRLDEYERRSRWLRVGCHMMFVLIFFTPAMTLFLPGLTARWPIFLAVALCCDLWIATTFYLAHKRLYPRSWAARWKALAIMLLAPTAAIRACHTLSRELLEGFDPLACAAVLCGEGAFRVFARRVLMDLAHPNPVPGNQQAQAIRDAFAERFARALDPILKHAGTNAADLVAPPVSQDGSCLSYCPRCDTQFTVASGTCEECGGVALLPLTTR